MPANLATSDRALADVFDVALLDLDGVVYIAGAAVGHAVASLAAARERGMRLAFVTNNAARPPGAVAERLSALGVPTGAEDVITSAQTAARELARRLPAGSAVLVVGTTGVREALVDAGLRPVASADDDPLAIVQGYSPELSWHDLAEGAVALGRGVFWVATNLDATVPSPRGRLPGNGSLVAALRHASGRAPDLVTGKPDPTMHRESVERSAARRPIVVGDRIDTDIAGAAAVGCPSLLVLTGVTDPAEVLACPAEARPSYLAADLRGLLYPHPPVAAVEAAAGAEVARLVECGIWSARIGNGVIELAATRAADPEVEAAADPDGDPPTGAGLDALRALAVAAWAAADDGQPVAANAITGADERAGGELARLGFD